jgi:hypothetical protein
MTTGATLSLELLVEEFQSILSFLAAGGNSKVEYTYSWYSASAGIKWQCKEITRIKL